MHSAALELVEQVQQIVPGCSECSGRQASRNARPLVPDPDSGQSSSQSLVPREDVWGGESGYSEGFVSHDDSSWLSGGEPRMTPRFTSDSCVEEDSVSDALPRNRSLRCRMANSSDEDGEGSDLQNQYTFSLADVTSALEAEERWRIGKRSQPFSRRIGTPPRARKSSDGVPMADHEGCLEAASIERNVGVGGYENGVVAKMHLRLQQEHGRSRGESSSGECMAGASLSQSSSSSRSKSFAKEMAVTTKRKCKSTGSMHPPAWAGAHHEGSPRKMGGA